jgi:predicted O-linked N-acetylglucosamine transferase (SPINDLY family)
MNRKQRRVAAKQGRAVSLTGRAGNVVPEARLLAKAASHHRAGRLEAAERLYRRILAVDPDEPDSLHLLGLIAHQTGHSDEALDLIGRAIAQNGADPDLHNDIAGIYHSRGRYDMAVAHCRKAVALNPNFVQAHLNLGRASADAYTALRGPGNLAEAISSVQRALTLEPDLVEAQLQLAYLRAHTCDWRDYYRESEQILAQVRQNSPKIDPFFLLSRPATPADQLRCARNWGRRFAVEQVEAFGHLSRAPSQKIRLGYLSQDFQEHPVAYLLAELIERHDRSRFEVNAYSYGPDDGGDMRRRLIAAFDRFTDLIGTDDNEAAARIHTDRIDVLIDLQGYTGRPRTSILAFRPAPIQVSFIGYTGTMGADFIDYILVDRFIAPMAQQACFSEKLVQLPHCYLPSDTTRRISLPSPSRTACGLPADGFVFCCFNNNHKLTPAFFEIWMRLLRGTPGSVLWLLESNSIVADNLRREATARDIAAERLVFAPRLPPSDHLARHRLADLFLDTLPYNAHTTASDALWAGLPVLTCAGATFAGRVAGSQLQAIGLTELITTSLSDYETRALQLAREPARLAEIRRELADNRLHMPLFDIIRYVRDIEGAFARMWEQWCKGEQPMPFALADEN